MRAFSGHRNPKSGTSHGGSAPAAATYKKWRNLMLLFVFFVVVAEIAFLGRLDIAKNAAIVKSWTGSFYRGSPERETAPQDVRLGRLKVFGLDGNSDVDGCKKWLEREDAVEYSRDFDADPILVSGDAQEWKTCAVGCKFRSSPSTNPDATFDSIESSKVPRVLRSMESSAYYAVNDVAEARRRGYKVIMTTSLSSDVPVGYFSWAEYDIMASMQPKTESALGAVFISNCAARNFRMKALDAIMAKVKIDSYGGCHRTRKGNVDKVEALKRYKFSLAFENSNEEDYVTEKFFQSLVAGSIPVVIGAPNIQDFAPSTGSVLHIRELKDAEAVAKKMKFLAENSDAYNKSVRWKYEGPSDSFKALLDMASVHSSCRLCIHLATVIQEEEEKSLHFHKRPCKCTRGSETVYHLYVRERGRFRMVSIFLRSGNLTVEAFESAVLMKFKALKHVPIWKEERPEKIRGDELKVYRVYPLGLTQKQALYTFKFKGVEDFTSHLERNPCAKFEVIFV